MYYSCVSVNLFWGHLINVSAFLLHQAVQCGVSSLLQHVSICRQSLALAVNDAFDGGWHSRTRSDSVGSAPQAASPVSLQRSSERSSQAKVGWRMLSGATTRLFLFTSINGVAEVWWFSGHMESLLCKWIIQSVVTVFDGAVIRWLPAVPKSAEGWEGWLGLCGAVSAGSHAGGLCAAHHPTAYEELSGKWMLRHAHVPKKPRAPQRHDGRTFIVAAAL